MRIKSHLQTNVLIAGWDDDCGPSLYFLDYLATLHKQNTAAHGYGAFFSLALMDKSWAPGMTMDEGVKDVPPAPDARVRRQPPRAI